LILSFDTIKKSAFYGYSELKILIGIFK